MPYNNAYNRHIARQVLTINNNKVAHDNAMNDNVRTNDVMSPLEGMALMKEDVVGGNGTVAATLHDLGYELTNGTHGETTVNQKRSRGGGVSAGGVSAGGVSAGGVSAGGVSAGNAIVGCGKGKSERAEIVRKVMREQKLSLPQASKYVKEHNLYTNKRGGALISLKNLDDMRPNQDPQTYATGGVQRL